jgi:hypothetical protein
LDGEERTATMPCLAWILGDYPSTDTWGFVTVAFNELYIGGEIYLGQKQYQLPHHQLSLIVTGQVNQLTYEPNHRSF